MKKESITTILARISYSLALNKKVFTVFDLHLYTGLKVSYIYKLTSSREIPHYKSPGGKKLHFKKSEIDDWLLSNPVKTKSHVNEEINLEREEKRQRKANHY